ncbi:hydrolase [Mycolicibacterium duvalii]|uniref:Hydrolase n=1 Tax=Mycolicibacterium duvalii TaxID=39688 RepID=A0A7I7K5W7_9MYCO|nr:SGNH/GDSL hydrolase family protein [Mycolicibacterium duvalii]MCV7369115.1 SGNH/GDSL hydrolase family protein [Mycolicibacterium duvalii]PEG44228.1 hydrolase [Mycolicibacterium duvalii]BBX18984.1 hydrolase [Mycolicibacterium duvalii]
MSRYVALGSSMAAGPGIRPRATGSPRRAGRSARNYPHLVADRLGLPLVDVTYSGAATAHVLAERQHGAPPQADALDGSESLVTVTIGGNDVGYVPMLFAAGLPRAARFIPLLGTKIRDLLNPQARLRALDEVGDALIAVGQTLRARAPRATVLFVDYLTLLPDDPPLRDADARLARHLAATLEQLTADAAQATGCGLVRAGAASRDHHAWAPEPWTTRFGVPAPGRPAPLHPNAAGMRAVAELVVAAVTG